MTKGWKIWKCLNIFEVIDANAFPTQCYQSIKTWKRRHSNDFPSLAVWRISFFMFEFDFSNIEWKF